MTLKASPKHGGLPTGGENGQTLMKTGAADYECDWVSGGIGLRPGQIILASSMDEKNYLKCDGRFLLRSEYPTLSAIIGAPIMMAEEETTFFNNSYVTSPYIYEANNILFSVGTVESTSTTAAAGRLLTSEDGTNWTSRTGFNPKPNMGGRSMVASNGTVYVMICGNDSTASSTDLSTWTRASSTVGVNTEICYGGTANRFFLVGSASSEARGLYSADGVAWSAFSHGVEDGDIVSIAANGSVVVLITAEGTIKYSADGTTAWTATSVAGLGGTPSRVSYTNGRFIISTSTGDVCSSPTGIVWTARGRGTPNAKIFWNGTVYVGTNGSTSKFSSNLNTWHTTKSIVSAVLSDKFWGRKALGTVFSVDTNAYNTVTHFPVPDFRTQAGRITGAYQYAQAWIKT